LGYLQKLEARIISSVPVTVNYFMDPKTSPTSYKFSFTGEDAEKVRSELHPHWSGDSLVLKLNTDYEVSYLAGYSVDGKTIYIDKRLPRWLTLKDGRKVDVYKYLVVHELWEKYLEDTMDYKYPYAHQMATGKEREAVERDGIDWNEYQDWMLTAVKKYGEFSESPKDLDTKPEKDTHDYRRYHKIEDLKARSRNELS